MRAIAVSIVVVDHLLLSKSIFWLGRWRVTDMGLVGVYIFFVHTCLVLMWSLERKPHTLNFYIRRLFRIYPLSIVIVLIAAATKAPVGWTLENFFLVSPLGFHNVVANVLLIQNLLNSTSQLVSVMWSLPLELAMYVFLPILFAFAVRERAMAPLLVAWFLIVAYLHVMLPQNTGNNFPAVIPDFLPGVIAYVGFRSRKESLPAWLLPAMLAGMCLLVPSFPKHRWDWPACLALGLLLPSFRQVRSRVAQKVSHTLAKYSYGIYLTHPFGIVIGVYLLRREPGWVQVVCALACTAVFSYAAYHLIEEPMIKVGTRIAARLERRHGVDNLSEGMVAS